jgi:Domain of Unknown Function with PDB structure (DUF3857)
VLTRRLRALGVVLCALLWLCDAAPAGAGDEWLPIPPEDLTMTAEPLAPGAPAIYLYRKVDRDDQANVEKDYIRIKILTEEGRKQGDIEIRYFPDEASIHNIKARTIHSDGAVIPFDGKVYDKTVLKARGLKFSAKTFTLPDVQVGSIVEYRYTIEENPDYVFFSHWNLNDDLFTRRGDFSVKLNHRFAVRYIGRHLPPGVSLPKPTSSRAVQLEVSNIPAFEAEDFMPPEDEVRSTVDFIYSANEEMDKVKFWKGEDKRMDENVGKFVGKHKELSQAASEIAPPGEPAVARLQKLYDKVASLRNTSYGVQKTGQELKRENEKPSSNVVEVWKRGEGSKTELNWLYLGLVRAAGFQAFAVAAPRRDRYFFFPETMNSSQLSEYIVLVKDGSEDLYFDPGSALTPFGLLPWAETEINGLRLDKDGGSWIKTALPASSRSRILRKASLKLDTQGSLAGKLTITFTGLEARDNRMSELNEDDTQRKTYLEQVVQQYVPVGIEVELNNKPDWTTASTDLVAEFNLKIPGWASGAGRKAFMPVGVFSGAEKHMFEHASRVYPIYFAYPYQTVDDVTIELPIGWRAGALPPALKRDIKFCSFENTVEEKAGLLHLTRTVAINGVFASVNSYSVLRAFFQELRAGDEQQIIILPAGSGSPN